MPLARRTVVRLATVVAAAVVAPIAWLPAGLAQAAPGQAGLPASAQPASPRVVVTFAWGGGLADQMPALQMFRKYGMHATYFVPSGLVCTLSQAECRKSSPYLTIADVREIAAYGNEIGGLSVTHQQLTTMPAAEATREICDDRLNLFRLGFRATDFAYPYALVSPAVEALTRACGYNAGLGAGTLNGAGLCRGCALAETIPPKDPYNVRTPIEVNSVNTMWTPGTFESIVTDAQRHGGGWIIFTIHDLCPTNCNLGTTSAILSAVLTWLHDQRSHNVAVEAMRQVIGGPVRPAVAGPAPPARPAPGVANADLAKANGGIPACFQLAAYGRSVASFSYRPGGGPHGSAAETIRVTRAGAANAKLVQAMDLGLCSPPVSPGRAYTAGVWYESSRPAQIDVYRRTSLGGWSYWTTSSFFPASTSWRQASWTTPAVPPGTTALSFGLTTNGVGTVTTSDYSLQLRDDVRKAREDSDPLAVLSPRERDVLAGMAGGKRATQIAEELLISADTVRTHTRSIFSKLDVRSRPEAVRVARAAGLRLPEHPETNGNGKPAAVPVRPRGRADGGGRAASNGRQPPAT